MLQTARGCCKSIYSLAAITGNYPRNHQQMRDKIHPDGGTCDLMTILNLSYNFDADSILRIQ